MHYAQGCTIFPKQCLHLRGSYFPCNDSTGSRGLFIFSSGPAAQDYRILGSPEMPIFRGDSLFTGNCWVPPSGFPLKIGCQPGKPSGSQPDFLFWISNGFPLDFLWWCHLLRDSQIVLIPKDSRILQGITSWDFSSSAVAPPVVPAGQMSIFRCTLYYVIEEMS